MRQKTHSRAASIVAGAAAALIAIGATVAIKDAVSSEPPAAPEPAADGSDPSSDAASEHLDSLGVVKPGQPCFNAVHSAPSALASAADQPIWLPKGATEDSVSDSWSCGEGSTPVLMFGEIQVVYQTGYADTNVTESWAGYIKDYGGYTFELSGRSVLVHEGTKDAPYNEVMIPMGDDMIRMNSLGDVPIDELVDLAKSLDLETPALSP